MKTIDRYVLREVTLTAAFAVAVLCGFLVFGNILRRVFDIILNHEIPLKYVGAFVSCLMPFCLTFAVPWGLITAVLLVFGRLASDNELTALRTNGMSILRITAPVLIFALVLSAACLWLNATFVPRAQLTMKRTLRDIAATHPTALVTANQVIDSFAGQRILVGQKKGSQLLDIHLFELDDELQPRRVIFAKSGEINSDPVTRQLQLRLSSARVEEWSAPFDPQKIHESLRLRSGETEVPLEQIFMRDLRQPPVRSVTLTRIFRYRDRLQEPPAIIAYEISRRFAFAVSCIALTLVSLPLAVGVHRSETSVAFGLSIVTAFSYFLLICVADSLREHSGAHPEILVWLPNAVFIGLGAVLFRRMCRQ